MNDKPQFNYTTTATGNEAPKPFPRYGFTIYTPEGEGWLEIRMNGESLEIRGLSYCKTDGKGFESMLVIKPYVTNQIFVTRLEDQP